MSDAEAAPPVEAAEAGSRAGALGAWWDPELLAVAGWFCEDTGSLGELPGRFGEAGATGDANSRHRATAQGISFI